VVDVGVNRVDDPPPRRATAWWATCGSRRPSKWRGRSLRAGRSRADDHHHAALPTGARRAQWPKPRPVCGCLAGRRVDVTQVMRRPARSWRRGSCRCGCAVRSPASRRGRAVTGTRAARPHRPNPLRHVPDRTTGACRRRRQDACRCSCSRGYIGRPMGEFRLTRGGSALHGSGRAMAGRLRESEGRPRQRTGCSIRPASPAAALPVPHRRRHQPRRCRLQTVIAVTARRWPWPSCSCVPTRVQGEGAERDICAALALAVPHRGTRPGDHRPGGGSREISGPSITSAWRAPVAALPMR